MPFLPSEFQADRLFTPREVANIFGVRTATIARWARQGRLDHMLTPGGHRRYRLAAVRELINMAESELGPENVERQTLEQDELVGHAVRPASDVYRFQLLPLQSLVVDQPTTEGLVREMSHVELHYSSTRIADAQGDLRLSQQRQESAHTHHAGVGSPDA